jgi:hypothetical protein
VWQSAINGGLVIIGHKKIRTINEKIVVSMAILALRQLLVVWQLGATL